MNRIINFLEEESIRIMTKGKMQGSEEMHWVSPRIFSDPDYTYDDIPYDKRKEKMFNDIMLWKAICSVKSPDLDEFERAMKKLSEALKHDDFTEVMRRTNNG